MSDKRKIYDGVITINSAISDNVVIGQDTYIRNSHIGNSVQINRRNIIEDASIGRYSYTGANTVLKAVDIGGFCSISWNVSATGNTHDYTKLTVHPFAQLASFGFQNENKSHIQNRIHIGNDVWIAANACIMPGITIGHGAVIGAGAVVTKDVPPFAVMAGNPAKVLKFRFDEEQIQRLLRVQWWSWPDNILKENIHLFNERKLNDTTILKLERIALQNSLVYFGTQE